MLVDVKKCNKVIVLCFPETNDLCKSSSLCDVTNAQKQKCCTGKTVADSTWVCPAVVTKEALPSLLYQVLSADITPVCHSIFAFAKTVIG